MAEKYANQWYALSSHWKIFTEFAEATNDVAAGGISEHRLTPIYLTI